MNDAAAFLVGFFTTLLIGLAIYWFLNRSAKPSKKLAAALAETRNPFLINAYGDYVGSADFNDEPKTYASYLIEDNNDERGQLVLTPTGHRYDNTSLFKVNQAWADEKDEFQNDAVDDLNELFEEMNEGKRAVNAQSDAIDNHADHIEGLLDSIGDFCNQLESVVVFEHADRIEDLQEDVASLEGVSIDLNTRILELEFLNLAERIAALEAKTDLPQLKIHTIPPWTYAPTVTYPQPYHRYQPTITSSLDVTANIPAPIDLDADGEDLNAEEVAWEASQERLAKALADRKAASNTIVQDFDQ